MVDRSIAIARELNSMKGGGNTDAQVANLMKQVDQLNAIIASRDGDINTLRNTNFDLRTQLLTKDGEIGMMKMQLGQKDAEIAALRSRPAGAPQPGIVGQIVQGAAPVMGQMLMPAAGALFQKLGIPMPTAPVPPGVPPGAPPSPPLPGR